MEPGHTNNPNGRPKGSLNKRNQEIQDLAKELGCNPAKILMLIALGDKATLKEDKDIDLFTRKDAAKELMPYLYGKRKPIDSNGDDSENLITTLFGQLDADK